MPKSNSKPRRLAAQRSTRTRGDEHEKKLAERLRGRVQPNSGASPYTHEREDVVATLGSVELLIQAKTTQQASHSVSLQALGTLHRNAMRDGKTPAYVVRFEQADEPTPDEWVMLPLDVLQGILDS